VNPSARIILQSFNPAITVSGLLGPAGARVTSGYGGWKVVERPRRTPITLWEAAPPLRVALELVLDGFISDISVEPECSGLERMASSDGAGSEPPIIKVSGAAIPHGELDWIIEELSWDAVLRNKSGQRVRQIVSLIFLQYSEALRLSEQKASARARSKTTTSSASTAKKTDKIYVVKSGQKLSTIAALELGSAARWHEIADLNGIRDPRSIKKGQRLKLP